MDGFDPRIVEHVLQGFDKSRPNSNMPHFGVTVLGETYGRERRNRWFTFRGYQALLNQENINEAEHELDVDLANTGGFADMSPELFYDTLDQLHQHQDTDSREETTKKKRKQPKNPILPDGTVKRGRPRKNQPSTSKRKRDDLEEDNEVEGQVRPLKKIKAPVVGGDVDADQGTPVAGLAPRKRGRPPKRKPEDEPPTTPTPRKRGRPPKNRTPVIVAGPETQNVGEQTLPKTTPTISTQGAISGITRDQDGPPVLSYPDVSEQAGRQGGPPETDTGHLAGGSRPIPPPELQLPIPEPPEMREKNQQDANGVRNPWPILYICNLLTVLLGLHKCFC